MVIKRTLLSGAIIFNLLILSSLFQLSAMTPTDVAMLKIFQQEEPELFKRVKLLMENDRDLLEISLPDVLNLMLKRSMTIETGRLGEQAAEAGLISVKGKNRHMISAKIQQGKTTSLSGTDLKTDAGNYLASLSTDSTIMSTTWSKKLDSGMTFSSTLQKTTSQSKIYTMTDSGDTAEGGTAVDDPLEAATLSAGVSIPFFQDSGDINDVTIHRSELAVEQSQLSTYSTTLSLLESTAKTYWNLVGIRENISTLKDAVELSKTLVIETEARLKVGILNPSDLKEVQNQLAINQQNLLTKQIQEQEVEDQIRAALNLGQISFGFKPADIPSIHNEQLDFRSLLDNIYKNDNTIRQLEVSLKSNQFDLDEALNLDKTNLDLSVQYNFTGYGKDTSEAIQNFSQSAYQGYQVGLTWSVPLFDKMTPQTIMKRKIERSKLELQVQDKKQQLAVSLQTNLRNLRFGLQEEKTAKLSMSLAKDLLDNEVEKLKLGKSTSYNVSLAQQKYTSAKLTETLVRVKSEQNFISLLVLTGQIFDYFKLTRTL